VHHFSVLAILAVIALGPASPAQQAPDPEATLQRIGQRLLADTDRMPRYTCVQTITRTYYDARAEFHRPTCSGLIAAHETQRHPPRALGWDRLRLEVGIVQGSSVFSWVGAPRFTNDTLDKLAGNGPLGSGDFGVFIGNILLRTTLEYQREEIIDGKRLLEYSYDMPVEKSGYKIKTSSGWEPTAYSGTLLLDPDAADLARLIVRTAELPASSSTCQAITEVTYGRTSIHDRLVLIPRETRLYTIDLTGSESQSQTSFANCREYASTVRLIFDRTENDHTKSDGTNSTAGTAPAMPSTAEPPAPLPAGLHFDARITTPINSSTAAAGDPIEAVLRSPMRDKNKAVIAPLGARLHGRLRNVKWWSEPGDHFQITVQFESVEIAGHNVPLSATLYPPHPARMTMGANSPRIMILKPEDASLGGTFFFQEQHVQLKSLDAQWITVIPDVGTEEK